MSRRKKNKQSGEHEKMLQSCTDIHEYIKLRREDILNRKNINLTIIRDVKTAVESKQIHSDSSMFNREQFEKKRILEFCDSQKTYIESGVEDAEFRKIAKEYLQEHSTRVTGKTADTHALRELQDCSYVAPPEMCEDCDVQMEIARDQPIMLCPLCHATHHFFDTTSSYYTKTADVSRSSHERIEHFVKVYLQKFQAKERFEVPGDVLMQVMVELRSEEHTPKEVTVTDVRECVRELKLSDYYYYTSQIYAKILNKPPPCLSDMQYQKILTCIKAIQVPFELAPKDRHNFLSYSYCMHKICELLGYNDFLEFFPILRGEKNKQKHDAIWQFICTYLNWEFRKSPTSFI